jgi:RHS repeat-associated protein
MGSLIAVQLPDGRLIQYITDGRNRRIGKKINGTLVKQWLYRDQLKPAAELDASGNIVAQFVYGTKPNVPDYVIRGGATYRVISDQLGSPVLAINVANSSDIPLQATYAAFGERTLIAGTDDWMPFGFAGGLYDPDTKLTRFGSRDYDAKIGRWVSKDPILFAGGQANIYVYVGNDPVNWIDPNGKGLAGGFAVWGICNAFFLKGLAQTTVEWGTYMDRIAELQREEKTILKREPFPTEEGEARCKEIENEIADIEKDFAQGQAKSNRDMGIIQQTLCVGLGALAGAATGPV